MPAYQAVVGSGEYIPEPGILLGDLREGPAVFRQRPCVGVLPALHRVPDAFVAFVIEVPVLQRSEFRGVGRRVFCGAGRRTATPGVFVEGDGRICRSISEREPGPGGVPSSVWLT